MRSVLLAATALLALGVAPVAAGPEGGSVVGGAATIQGQGGPAVIVNQSTPSAIINWNTFNIRANESVRFNQPSASSVALNRVTGGLGPSEIMGTLTANGRVFIINRDGILFGPGSVVNTAGFLATTNDIKNADFMAGRYNFNIPGRPDASIVNQGRITATSGGFAALVAPGVRNSGTITATLGTVALASGNSFTLDMYGDKLITLAVGDSIANKVIDVATGRPLKSLVSNTKSGTLSANGGRVELTAAAARAVVDSVINTKGVIRADSIGRHNGMIVLNAATGGSKPAGAPAQTIKLAGTISAAGKHRGTTGGTIVVSGEHIKLANAKDRCLRPPRRRQDPDRRRLGRRPSGPEPRHQCERQARKLHHRDRDHGERRREHARSTPRRPGAATAARSCCGPTARPPSPAPFSLAAAPKAAVAGSWRSRANNS